MASASAKSSGYLDGQMLIAMPNLQEGPFARSLVYLCAHREDGAMGIIVNHSAPAVNFPELLVQLGIVNEKEAIVLPPRAGEIKVLRGGPVETGRGYGWLHCPADAGLIFDSDFSAKYERALAKIGVSVAVLSGEGGRA
jgi:putative AlgH/UPF0301 family transcriptional regulator